MNYKSLAAKELSAKEKYFMLIGGVAPRPIAWVATVSKDGRHNIAPFSFFNAFSSNPPIVIFLLQQALIPQDPLKIPT